MERKEDVVKKYIIKLYSGGVVSPSIPEATIKTSAVSIGEAIKRVLAENPGSIVTYCQEE